MPCYKDESNGTWFCQFYYTDYTGTRKKKKKRGFSTKREAALWERDFLSKQQDAPTMTFSVLVDLYFEDMAGRLRKTTIENKRWTVTHKIAPYFGSRPINSISPADVRKWQADMMAEGYSGTYLRMMNTQFSAVMNYAVRYYNLGKNPCRTAGTMGAGQAKEMKFWTNEEFTAFIKQVEKPAARAAFLTLYYTGIRIGELMALTPSDFDIKAQTLSITKSLRMVGKEVVISPPKTAKSTRTITLPAFLCTVIEDYKDLLYGLTADSRLFPYSRAYYTKELAIGADKAGVKRIRLHDLRHSHASLLIEMDTPPLLVAERLGHDSVETTLNTYSHLFPTRRDELIELLNKLEPK